MRDDDTIVIDEVQARALVKHSVRETHEAYDGDGACPCEMCVTVRLLSSSPTRPMDPTLLAQLVAATTEP